jgi:hypothetical protein
MQAQGGALNAVAGPARARPPCVESATLVARITLNFVR